MEKVVNVAQYFFEMYKELTGEVVDEMKLHKLLYFAQRESLAITNTPLFKENFEGWKYGPVCKEVRNCYTKDGMYGTDIEEISTESMYIANNILEQYGAYESWKLSQLSHKEISWINSREGLSDGQNGNREMKIEDIRKDSEKVRPYDSVWDMYYDEFEDVEGM